MNDISTTDKKRGNEGISGVGKASRQPLASYDSGLDKKQVPFIDGLKAREVQVIPLEEISATDTTFQYRFSSLIGDLKTSLSQEGQKEPIDLIGAKPHIGNRPYRVVDGFRRLEALRNLGWTTVKALIHRDISDEEAHKLAFIKNVVRKNLLPMDKANAIYLAKQRGRRDSDLAREFNLSEKQLKRYEALLTIAGDLQRLVDKGVLSMAHARVLSDFGAKDVGEWVKRIDEDRMSVKQLKRELRRATGVQPLGRQKVYMKADKNRIRMYAFSISRNAPRDERQKVVKILQNAIELLKG